MDSEGPDGAADGGGVEAEQVTQFRDSGEQQMSGEQGRRGVEVWVGKEAIDGRVFFAETEFGGGQRCVEYGQGGRFGEVAQQAVVGHGQSGHDLAFFIGFFGAG